MINNTCKNSCGVTNCVTCVSGVCAKCNNGYLLDSHNNYCNLFCNVPNCNQCSSQNYCSICSNNLIVSTFGDQCVLCNISNCFSCEQSNSCFGCNNGYILIDNQCITCNIDNCYYCKENNVCSICAYPYSPQGGLCVLCLPPCQKCFADGSCSTCLPPFSQVLLVPGSTCFLCDDPNCITCSYTNSTILICTDCAIGYTIVNGACNWGCSQIQCSLCSQNNGLICSQCNQYYYVNPSNSSCILCPNTPRCLNCMVSTPNLCLLCAPGFFLSSGLCIACPAYCSVCNSSTLCTKLAYPTGKAIMIINNSSVLVECDQGCSTCSSTDPSKCSNCSQGYVLSSGVCMTCSLSSNCQTCTQNNFALCTSCFPNSFLNNISQVCVSCTSPCLTCTNINQLSNCTSCPSGYSLNNGNCLQPPANNGNTSSASDGCGLNCGSCIVVGNISTCKLCVTGTVLSSFNGSNGYCLPCLIGCSICSSSNYGTCISCFQGNYLDASNGNICTPCIANCFSCTAVGCQ